MIYNIRSRIIRLMVSVLYLGVLTVPGCEHTDPSSSSQTAAPDDSLYGTIGDNNMNVNTFEKANFSVYVNWEQLEMQAPIYRYDDEQIHCYLSIQDVASGFGMQCEVEGDTAMIRNDEKTVFIKAGAENAVIGGESVKLPVAAGVLGKTMLLRDDSINVVFGSKSDYTPALNSFNFSNEIVEGRKENYKGRNLFMINEKPYMPLMYSGTEQGRTTWKDPTKSAIQGFIDQGYEIIQTDTWFKYVLKEDGTFEMASLRTQIAAILQMQPEAKIVVRINVSAPQWWLDTHPDEVNKVTNPNASGNFGGNKAESFASEEYRAFAKEYLEKFLKELAASPEGNHVAGIHIGGGVYGEWHYWGIRDEGDASKPMCKRFARYGIEKYGSLEEANAVWHTNFSDENAVEVPSYTRRRQVADKDYRDPRQDQYVIDYYMCQQETVSTLVEELAKLTKETWGRPVITGVFYGYFYGGFTVGAEAGQMDVERLFRSPYLDYFAGPYSGRDMYGSGCYRSLADSASLNGKIWLTEHDGGTYLGSSGDGKGTFPGIPANEPQTIARMRRNFMYSITENGGQWWYDFGPKSQGGGWWDTPGLLKEAKDLLDLSDRLMEQGYEKPADVLFVYDMDSFYYMRPKVDDKTTNRITEDASNYAIFGTGACFDRIFLMDLEKTDISKYKMVIFGNIFCLNEQQRDYIRNTVMKDGRTVVFMSGAGYIDGEKNDVSLISSLTGMTIKSNSDSTGMSVMLAGVDYTLDSKGINNTFYVDDVSATPIGSYCNGKTAAAYKNVGDCKVYYFGLPFDSKAAVYKSLMQENGVYAFAAGLTERDYVSVGGGIIGVYSVTGGEKVIKPLDGSTHTVTFPAYTTYYFDMTSGEQLNY